MGEIKRLRHWFVRLLAPQFCRDTTVLPRPMVEYIKNSYEIALVGVEVGVAKGVHAESMLKTLVIERLFLVDPYIPYPDLSGKLYGTSQDYVEATKRLANYDDRITWVLKKSVDALNDLPNQLDFVYLDGNHNYETVWWELNNFYPKIKVGGVLGGHNFQLRWMGVCHAVCKFLSVHKEVDLAQCYSHHGDWWIIKP